jgi:hypothetical protein
MTEVPKWAGDYHADDLALVKAGCLTVATSLGDLMREIVIVGGYVPSLLIDIARDEIDAADPLERHVGTLDLDLAFAVTLLDDERYSEVAKQLKSAGFEPEPKDNGQTKSQTWRYEEQHGLKVDFLIAPTGADDEGGKLKNLEKDFAAFIIPGLSLVHQHFEEVTIEGITLRNALATATVRVCSAPVYIFLKASAMGQRGKDKDDYDAYYVLRNHSEGVDPLADDYAQLIVDGSKEAADALEMMRKRYAEVDSVGPVAVSQFVNGANDDELQADARAFFLDFVEAVDLRLAREGR